ncbi:unnamed protein product, partial [Nesidiocoris tenuis]
TRVLATTSAQARTGCCFAAKPAATAAAAPAEQRQPAAGLFGSYVRSNERVVLLL